MQDDENSENTQTNQEYKLEDFRVLPSHHNRKDPEPEKKEIGKEELDQYHMRPICDLENRSESRFWRSVHKYLWYTFMTASAAIGIGGATILCILYFFSADIPEHGKLRNYVPLIASRVFLQDGRELCEYSYEKRYFVPFEYIPKKLVDAFISAEDKNFYQHYGIDFLGIARSLITNLRRIGDGKRPHGASTITQQVARIFLIKNNEISYLRKIKEAILSYRLENTFSKQQIMELYLNQIYLGLGTYGVAAAAKEYFNKSLDELTIGECAYLAGLAKGANNYHPKKHHEKAVERRNWVISKMLANGYISEQQYNESVKEDFVVAENLREPYDARYFAEEIRKYIIEKYPFESLNKEGLIIRATLDSRLQKLACDALQKGLEKVDRGFGWRGALANISEASRKEIQMMLKNVEIPQGGKVFQRAVVVDTKGKILLEDDSEHFLDPTDLKWAKTLRVGDVILVKSEQNKYRIKQLPKVQGAIVVIDVNNGRVLAMQGGYSFDQSEFNRVTQAVRQVGSTFKPFVYLAGLESGFYPNSIIDASPIEIDLGPGLGIWRPRNYHGAVMDKMTFRQAIEKSVNTATIRIAKEVGMAKIADIAKRFGLFDDMPEYFSYAIGAGETTLMRLTTAYAMFANGGKQITPTMIDYIEDRNGKVLYRADNLLIEGESENGLPPKLNDTRPQILDEQSIYQITSLLEGVIQRGSGASARFLNIPLAGKTGTSNESRDTWFVGYTPDIAVGVFVGFDDHNKSLGKNANGAVTALPIFIDFMKDAKKFFSPKPFKVPQGISLRKIDVAKVGSPGESVSLTEAFKKDEQVAETPLIESIPQQVPEGTEPQDVPASDEAKQVFGVY